MPNLLDSRRFLGSLRSIHHTGPTECQLQILGYRWSTNMLSELPSWATPQLTAKMEVFFKISKADTKPIGRKSSLRDRGKFLVVGAAGTLAGRVWLGCSFPASLHTQRRGRPTSSANLEWHCNVFGPGEVQARYVATTVLFPGFKYHPGFQHGGPDAFLGCDQHSMPYNLPSPSRFPCFSTQSSVPYVTGNALAYGSLLS